jgi:hypothetical protein
MVCKTTPTLTHIDNLDRIEWHEKMIMNGV